VPRRRREKGGLDLTSLNFDLKDPQLFEKWVKVHDSVADGEMPPKKKPRPDAKLAGTFLDRSTASSATPAPRKPPPRAARSCAG
jgi:hypothetical protein